jgi:hypothetical protein
LPALIGFRLFALALMLFFSSFPLFSGLLNGCPAAQLLGLNRGSSMSFCIGVVVLKLL